ncbi:hypothetical protein L2E82_53874 [Cichorium intybus]|nr:hypothetical protein L2E82_53874 [Cichorium intybus]
MPNSSLPLPVYASRGKLVLFSRFICNVFAIVLWVPKLENKVTVDNIRDRKATLIKVDSANKRGSLLEMVQYCMLPISLEISSGKITLPIESNSH